MTLLSFPTLRAAIDEYLAQRISGVCGLEVRDSHGRLMLADCRSIWRNARQSGQVTGSRRDAGHAGGRRGWDGVNGADARAAAALAVDLLAGGSYQEAPASPANSEVRAVAGRVAPLGKNIRYILTVAGRGDAR